MWANAAHGHLRFQKLGPRSQVEPQGKGTPLWPAQRGGEPRRKHGSSSPAFKRDSLSNRRIWKDLKGFERIWKDLKGLQLYMKHHEAPAYFVPSQRIHNSGIVDHGNRPWHPWRLTCLATFAASGSSSRTSDFSSCYPRNTAGYDHWFVDLWNLAMEYQLFIDDFLTKTSIVRGCSCHIWLPGGKW